MVTTEQRKKDRDLALDPANSVAVEACAGSGKTWLLSGRLLRLLLAGVRPGEILAITYTRKAAREIETRLRGLLASLAGASEAEALAMLVERGLSEAQARACLPRARGLFEAVLHAEPAITITTFHGWFARLLGGAPLDSGLAGRSLSEAAASLLDEAWTLLAADCAREPEADLARALLFLYAELGASGTRKLLGRFVDRRAEWRVWREAQGGLVAALARLDEAFGAGGDPLAEFFSPARLEALEAFARLLGQNTAGDQALAVDLAQAVLNLSQTGGEIAPADLEAVRTALLTAKNEPRARKPGGAQAKRLGAEGEARFLSLHGELGEALIDALGRLQDQRNARLNREALIVGEALLERLDKLKAERRVMDFADLEGEVDGLLAREGSAAWLQARLDARYKHILLDEFQDTNPLQWRILRGWLDAYGEAGASRPGVFLVGDPKQSIYRFRRAEPRLFTAAAEYFEREFGAHRIGNAHTFRNAPRIVAIVNELFGAEPLFTGFLPQTTEHEKRQGRIEVLPLIPAAEDEEAVDETAMRNPLITPRVEAEDGRRREEAELLARRLGEIVGRGGQAWLVQGKAGERPARFGDILILTRRTTQLAPYEAALREAGIPYTSPGRGGLLGTLEAQDVIATLRFLADPADDLALAQVLRMPVFAMGDDWLLSLSAEPREPWWRRLQALASSNEDPALSRCVRLLRGWIAASRFLPAHDLIDRMFHEGEWLERCRAVLQDALWPGVQSNLEALLELSLDVDAGRYPSITRLVDELKRLSGADEDAPDEGLIAAQGEDMGRVRIMTIHGAKGLEAPIVWLIDAQGLPRPREGNDVALDWPAEEKEPLHFSLLGRISEAGPLRQSLLEADKEAAQREELNLLYVAITRAEQAFFVSGIAPSRKLGTTTAYERIEQAALRLGAVDGVLGELPVGKPVKEAARETACSLALQAPLRVGEIRRAAPGNAGQAFGTAMHAWLEAHTKGLALPEVEPEVEAAAKSLLARPSLRRFFDPAAYVRAGSETSFIGPNGKLRRIDRWVDDGETIWVLDYKSGQPPSEDLLGAYRAQLEDYRGAMRAIFEGRVVRALLVFSEGAEIEV